MKGRRKAISEQKETDISIPVSPTDTSDGEDMRPRAHCAFTSYDQLDIGYYKSRCQERKNNAQQSHRLQQS